MRSRGAAWRVLAPAALLILAGAAVYSNALTAPFVFDDHLAIVENPTLRTLWPPWDTGAARASALNGRPVATLSFAANYALGGLDVRGYHAVNVGIHLLCALALFGIVRRTLASRSLGERWGPFATSLGFATALVWIVHPLATEAVTYVVQRTESLMALFYLLTLYAAIRSHESRYPVWWWWIAVASCVLGMGTKEVMLTCPLAVWLHDVVFGERGEWRDRSPLYISLASCWFVPAVLMRLFPRPGSVGFDLGVGAWGYFKGQCLVVWDYLHHAFWPVGLVFDYGVAGEVDPLPAVVGGIGLTVLVVTAVGLLLRRHAAGFPATWFFLVLAPTSSFIPIATEVGAERRVYLPLVGLVVLIVCGVHAGLERLGRGAGWTAKSRGWIGAAMLVVVVAACSIATLQRNREYRSEESIWSSAVRATPANARAYNGLGRAILNAGRPAEALGHLSRSLDLDPGSYHARFNMGATLSELGRDGEAVPYLVETRDLRPDRAAPRYLLGRSYLRLGRWDEAIVELEAAIRLAPDFVPAHEDLAIAHNNLANLYQLRGRLEEAVTAYLRALELDPAFAEAHNNLGMALVDLGRPDEAVERFREAIRLRADFAVAHRNLGRVLQELGRETEAADHDAD